MKFDENVIGKIITDVKDSAEPDRLLDSLIAGLCAVEGNISYLEVHINPVTLAAACHSIPHQVVGVDDWSNYSYKLEQFAPQAVFVGKDIETEAHITANWAGQITKGADIILWRPQKPGAPCKPMLHEITEYLEQACGSCPLLILDSGGDDNILGVVDRLRHSGGYYIPYYHKLTSPPWPAGLHLMVVEKNDAY